MERCKRCRKDVETEGSIGFSLNGDSGFVNCPFYNEIKKRHDAILKMSNSFEQAVAKRELYEYCNAFNRCWCKLALKMAENVRV